MTEVWVVVVSNRWGDDAWVYAVMSSEDAAKAKLSSLGSDGRVEGPFTMDDRSDPSQHLPHNNGGVS